MKQNYMRLSPLGRAHVFVWPPIVTLLAPYRQDRRQSVGMNAISLRIMEQARAPPSCGNTAFAGIVEGDMPAEHHFGNRAVLISSLPESITHRANSMWRQMAWLKETASLLRTHPKGRRPMSRKLKIALTGFTLLLTVLLACPVLATARQIAEQHSQGGYHVLFIPVIIMIVYMLVGGALSIAFLIWLYNNHKWPFDGSWFRS